MKKKSNKILLLTIVVSISLNLLFAINYFAVKQNNMIDFKQSIETILHQIQYADSLLNDGDDRGSDYETRITLASFEITKSRSLVDTYAKELPRNLVSWIGEVELGLRNGAIGVDESGFKSTIQDLRNFNDGFEKEVRNLHNRHNHTEVLEIIEDVLSSQEYMGDNYVNK